MPPGVRGEASSHHMHRDTQKHHVKTCTQASVHMKYKPHTCSWACIYEHKCMYIYAKHILLYVLRQSFRSSYNDEHGSMHSHAGACKPVRATRHTHVHRHKQTAARTQKLIRVCTHPLSKPRTLNRSISCNICAFLSLGERRL